MRQRMNRHRNPNSKCTGTQLFALGDPDWRILEIVESENAGDREEWHIANTLAATNVNDRSRPLEGAGLRTRLRKKKWNAAHRCPVKQKLYDQTRWNARNAEAVALGYKNNYHRLKAERIAAGFIVT